MFKLGILGGTFNPIHIGHLILSQYVLEELKLNRVLFMPSGNPPHKRSFEVESGVHRINMVKEAVKFNENFDLSDIEIKRQGITYTYDTLREIHNRYNNVEINFIVGYDTLLDMENWHRIKDVVKLASFVVVNRNIEDESVLDYAKNFSMKYGGNIKFVKIPNIDISSSEIRDRVKQDKSIMYMVTEPVHDYIIMNNLYRGDFI